MLWISVLYIRLVIDNVKVDRVISPAVRAKNTSNSGRNDAATLYYYLQCS